MREIDLNVEGMVCGGCEKRVENVLLSLNGIEKVVANHQNNTVLITASNELNIEEVKEKIEDLGFEIK